MEAQWMFNSLIGKINLMSFFKKEVYERVKYKNRRFPDNL